MEKRSFSSHTRYRAERIEKSDGSTSTTDRYIGKQIMKIAFTSVGPYLSSPLDTRFGRAPGFLIVDSETQETTYESNEQNLNAAQGAGIQSAQNVAATGAKAVVSGHCGPKAFRILNASKIAIYPSSAATVQEALDLYLEGKLTEAEVADVEGHWV